jgi:hypothetical protein
METTDTKRRWPELVGKPGSDAEETIKSERPDLNEITLLPEHSPFTLDYKEDRVRVFVDDENNIVSAPTIG